MSWKFNPPPGWPQQPEGWQPPPGWTPDPSWPAAPAGWQFWVPASADAGDQPAATVPGAATPAGGTTPAQQPFQASVPQQSGPPGSPYQQQSSPPQQQVPQQQGPPYQTAPQQGAPQQGVPYQGAAPYQTGPPGSPYSGAGSAPAADKPWHHRWWVFGAAASALLLAGCVAGSGIAMITHSEDGETTTNPGPPTSAPTDGPGDPTGEPEPPSDPGGSGLSAGETRTGEGPTIVSLNLDPDSLHAITVTYPGDGMFTAKLIDDSGEQVGGALAISFGAHSGTYLVELGHFGGSPTAVDIEDSEGEWELELHNLDDVPAWPSETTGEGDSVLRIDWDALDEGVGMAGEHDGSSNFIVVGHQANDQGYNLLFNEIGVFSGESQESLVREAVALEIVADGEWVIEPD
ncbi:hypothetical protein JQS43_17155 [Natronosporangium hydrolyticum]|uniref:Uncharacterized protein n=1 Tax=Natronosporangium hydrolyticum TaxID=2811111 RepID=A0A895YAM4_9ACTN|nr:hypothetical protein [Natronosporangium hydrolyticum]QSB13345.1 hypothetical protein JQS43_17155 [Natronosporangium hydrolyticum]